MIRAGTDGRAAAGGAGPLHPLEGVVTDDVPGPDAPAVAVVRHAGRTGTTSFAGTVFGVPQQCGRRRHVLVDAAHAKARATSDPTERKKAYETVARKFLAEGSVVYLYHRRVLVALTDKVEGYKQMPDGLIRVVGVKVK